MASDLDGTLFPTDPSQHPPAMQAIARLIEKHQLRMVFVTGRSFAQVLTGIAEHDPPSPEAIICDVGSTIMVQAPQGSASVRHDGYFVRHDGYHDHLLSKLGDWDHARLTLAMEDLGLPLVPQPPDQQTDLKCSFDYPPQQRREVAATVRKWIDEQRVPVSMTISVDPFTNTGLMDLLPRGTDKGSALAFWINSAGVRATDVIFAGDTGNDSAAINSGVRAVIVGNADNQLRAEARGHHGRESSHLFESRNEATAGVLEGLRHYLNVV